METAFAHSLLMEGAAAAAISQLDRVARQRVTWRSLATTLLQEPANPLNLSVSIPPHLAFFFSPPSRRSPLIFLSKIAFNVTGSLFFILSHGTTDMTDNSVSPPLASDKCLLICTTGHLHKRSFDSAAFRCSTSDNVVITTTTCERINPAIHRISMHLH